MSMSPATPVSTANAPHYRWGEVCDGWYLLQGEDLSVIEESMPPGSAELRHRHVHAQQFFYILAGEATLELEGATHRLQVGQGLHIAPGAAHQMRNASREALRFIVISSPNSHGDRELIPLPQGSAGASP